MTGTISIYEIRDKIRLQILSSIGNLKIQILKSKSGFPNGKHPKNLIGRVTKLK